ncbi:MAG TPA: hypothetical protein VIQ27_04910 [Gemmatimonadales bacterium]
MKLPRRALPALLLVLLLAGCAQTFDATTLGVPVTMSSPAAQPPQGDRFRVGSRAVFGFWGTVKLREPSLRKALAAQLGGASGVADLRIKVRSRFSDLLITGLTLGIIVPRSVTFEGVVTK